MADRAGVPRKPIHAAEKDQYQIVGKFVGDWMPELGYLLQTYHGGRQFNFLTKIKGGTVDPYTLELDKHDMEAAGIPLDTPFVSKITPTQISQERDNGKLPIIGQMIDWFEFTGLVLPKIHIQRPGQVFPFHFDDLTTHRNNTADSAFVDEDPDRFARIEVQLKPWDYGHVWAIGNNYWSDWEAGEIMYHSWYNIPHGTANCGSTARICLQITGEVTPEVLAKLKRNNGNIDLRKM